MVHMGALQGGRTYEDLPLTARGLLSGPVYRAAGLMPTDGGGNLITLAGRDGAI